jgi:hypothetical protein
VSERELWAQWQRLHDLPYSQVMWREEVMGRNGHLVHRRTAAGTPQQAIARWRALLARCHADPQWHAARLTVLDPHPD